MRLTASLLIVILSAAPSFAAMENLDEVMARKSRLASAPWSYSVLQGDAASNYTWQPETLQYTDTTTGSEVWRLTYTPSGIGGETQDIATTHWSANGNRMMLHTTRPDNVFYGQNGTAQWWMLVNTDGSRMRPAKNAAAQLATQDPYIMWSPIIPDVLYSGNANEVQGLKNYVLYKVTVSDSAISREEYLTLPTGSTISVKKAISGDGRKAALWYSSKLWPVTLYPEASKQLDLASGYSVADMAFDNFWGNLGSTNGGTWASFHDKYLSGAVNGADGIWNVLMPSYSDGPFWRARLTNAAGTGAPTHVTDRTAPYNFGGEVEPVNTITDASSGGSSFRPNPWCADGSEDTNPSNKTELTTCNVSPNHGAPDRWGRYIIGGFNKGAAGKGYGLGFWDMRTHVVSNTFSWSLNNSLIQNSIHPDWSAWSDWSIAEGTHSFIDPQLGANGVMKIATQNYKNAASQRDVAYYHMGSNSGGAGTALYIGPTQSPDGTKIAFVSQFMNASDSDNQQFWTVAYYPFPPEIKSAAKNGANVRLTWDFNQGTAGAPNLVNPRTYSTRGWPHETNDLPPSPREVDKFRVWVSSDNSTWTPLATVDYNNCRGANECGTWTETAWSYDAAQSAGTTRYYAVTSVEFSKLESHTLSNVWKVTLDGGGNVTAQTQQTAYPADPGGKVAFYTAKPAAITATATHQKAPATSAGQYTVEWSAPADASLIRHYNIYAKDGGTLTATQQMRIASVPVGTTSYVDWLGDTGGTTQYLVTAVDYQGNESSTTSPTHRSLIGRCVGRIR